MKLKQLIPILTISIVSFNTVSAQEFISKKKKAKIYHDTWIDFNKNKKKDIYEDSNQPLDTRINNLISQMSLDEKTCQMATLYGFGRVLKDELPGEDWNNRVYKDGIGNIDEHLNGLAYHKSAETQYSWPPSNHAKAINEVQRFFVEDTRLGIPVDFTNEGIRGLCHDGATSFPAQIGIGSTWDKDLVSEIGAITGKEARVLGYTNVYSPILDLARDPRWGRTVECYGEDPYLVSQLGVEMVKALQVQNVVSTAKHFAVYSAPKGGRDGDARTDPHITEREMHEIYLEPFRTVVQEGGLKGIMSSYNDYNGIPVTGSHYFLTEVLRDQWGFKGYVVSDSWAVGGLKGRHHIAEDFKETVYLSVMAGLNVRTNFSPAEDFILPLRELVNEGRIPVETINARVRDVLRVKFELGLFDSPYVNNLKVADEIVHNQESEHIALKASRKSLVLLKNSENLLPIKVDAFKNILVTGPNAKAINHSISRYGPSNVKVQSVFDGIKNFVGNQAQVEFAQGCDFYDTNWPKSELYSITPDEVQQKYINEAVSKAKESNLIIVAVGDNEDTVGESKSRTSLDLPGNQLDLIKALYETGKPIVVVLINGRPLSINWVDDHISSVIEAWFPGEYGGQAVAEAIFGAYNPGGKLSVTFPRTVGQIPFNFPYKRSSQKGQGKTDIGQTRINTALYPFGYGLSYTTFEYSDLKITPESASNDVETITVSFKLKNTGDYEGDEVPQLYIQDEFASVVTYTKVLRGFERVTLKPGQEKEVTMTLQSRDLSLLNKDMKRVVEPGIFKVFIGSSSEDDRLTGQIIIK
ncbi:glycoside hydrolase family 3 N-terminal domain-containing protein [Aestuariibaculum suncheonense]|uniref:beta-glucosidase n=1 Tax=Aestuariibaculum suncheonense TaxID=1028745 RepID=A0A8J6QGL4_9FLAO|nr:glycoside hydrolase family 3 N-terminal domain-containing protein [Aestuariibaculum suncheonense]MBD0835557.1 glycoside hydrolase family 3 C-terminal domain-containing protein [Aestuariibaculum suncheonense]